jgi:hypothetical protein
MSLFDLDPLIHFLRNEYRNGSQERFVSSLEQECEQEFGESVDCLMKCLQGNSMSHTSVGLVI